MFYFHIFQSVKVGELLRQQEAKNKVVACICAAPIALSSHKIGTGKKVTSHPVVESQMIEAGKWSNVMSHVTCPLHFGNVEYLS